MRTGARLRKIVLIGNLPFSSMVRQAAIVTEMWTKIPYNHCETLAGRRPALGRGDTVCGICGQLSFDLDRDIQLRELAAMCASLRHRGPDDLGIYHHGAI